MSNARADAPSVIREHWASGESASGSDRRLTLVDKGADNANKGDHGNEVEVQGYRPYIPMTGNDRRADAVVSIVLHGIRSPIGGMASATMSSGEARKVAEMLILSANEADTAEGSAS